MRTNHAKSFVLTACFICLAAFITTCLSSCKSSKDDVDEFTATSLTLSAGTLSIAVGETSMLSITVLPITAAEGVPEWATSNATVATVNGGIVKGIAPGKATIMVSMSGKSASCAVTVTPAGD